jgi:hypothetical protein
MLHVTLVYAHLLATCVALGSILASDLRLITRLRDADFRLAPPAPFVATLITASLVVLLLTGGALVAMGLQQRADFTSNPKLHAKLVLVAALVANAMVLHRSTFPWLARGKRLKVLSTRIAFGVALPVAMSLALWLYVAFLGVARPWNFTMPARDVLAIGAALVASCWPAAMLVVLVAARGQKARHAARRGLRRASHLAPLAAADASSAFGPIDAQRVAAEALDKARRGGSDQRTVGESIDSIDSILRARPRDDAVALAGGGSR